MELATAALGSLLRKLGTLLTDEYKLQKGVRGEIKFLQAEMESMQGALNKVSKLQPHQVEDDVKIWARDLKELVYDIEDSVDAFMVRVDNPVHAKPHSFRKFFDRTMGLLTKITNRHHIADDIQDIKRRIHEVADRRGRYRFEDTAGQPDTTFIDPRLPGIYEEAAKLVGTDGPAQKISNLLTQGTGMQKQRLMVVSIVGVGGLGKTTIANLVYERLGGQFDCKAFVSVSLKPDMKQILSSILRQVSKDRCTNTGEKNHGELIRNIRDFLVDKRYFIVIDDLWRKEAWDVIKCALVDKNVGSRVIVTTRNIDVANFSSVDGEVYELDPLSDENSRILLCKRVFSQEDRIYYELEEVTEKILKKCGGIPLAIITIASMLASIPNKTKYDWYRVYSSMGCGLEKDKTLDNMRKIIHLSYGDLPSHLKPCLLYVSLFPEDYPILIRDLVRLWVAEGFVDEKQGSNLYDLGERYFNELVNRSMIQVIGERGVAVFCRVHDMILDLIISLSAQENFATIPEGPHLKSTVYKIRRISLQDKVDGNREDSKEDQEILPATLNMSHARSLIVFKNAVQWMPHLSSFSVLRVLSLKGVLSKIIHPKDLGSLHLLRYLELGCGLELEIPEGIGNLKLLKTLVLWGPSTKELPRNIFQLRLECLSMRRYIAIDTDLGFKLPDGLGNLTSLQELSILDVEKSPNTLAELGKLTKLRVLTISGLAGNESYVKSFLQSLSNLCNLRTLRFGDDGGPICLDGMPDQWRVPVHLEFFDGGDIFFSELPRWFSSLSELSWLSIRVEVLRQEDLQLLGALPVLRSLTLVVLSDSTTEGRLVVGIDQPFRSLAEFEFLHYTGRWLVFGQGVMPKLQRLKLYVRARRYAGFDFGLENLTSLKRVTVEVVCDGATTTEVENLETKIREAVDRHPKHPALDLSRYPQDYMADDENEDMRVLSDQEST